MQSWECLGQPEQTQPKWGSKFLLFSITICLEKSKETTNSGDPNWYLLVQSQQWKQHNLERNLFNVKNKDT